MKRGSRKNKNSRDGHNTTPDECLPFPCIVTFGGSALREGGGYAQAELHVLETVKPEGAQAEEEESDEEGAGAEGGRKPSTMGFLGALESAAGARKQPFNKFQT